MWSNEEMIGLVNDAADRGYKIMRLARNTILTRSIRSTGAAIDLVSESYTPSSLRLASGTFDYTLPPDFVRVESITPNEVDYDGIRFKPTTFESEEYIEQRVIPTADLQSVRGRDHSYYYVLLGERTIRFVPTPQDTINIDLNYSFRPPRLLSYTANTVSVTNASTAVTSAGSEWLEEGMRTPAELVVGATTVSLDVIYPTVSTIDSDTGLTLSRTYQDATNAAATYALVMVPLLPVEHHSWLASTTAALMLRKTSLEASNAAVAALEKQLLEEVYPEVTFRQLNESLQAAPYKIP